MSIVEEAVLRCRELTRSFVIGDLDYAGFREEMARAMGPLDPLDWAVRELSAERAREAEAYVKSLGGQFGEEEERIPRRPEWVYGASDEPYGWVDQEAYRAQLREVFSDVLRLGT